MQKRMMVCMSKLRGITRPESTTSWVKYVAVVKRDLRVTP